MDAWCKTGSISSDWEKQHIFVMAVNNSVELEAYVLFMIEPRLIETDVASIEKSLF